MHCQFFNNLYRSLLFLLFIQFLSRLELDNKVFHWFSQAISIDCSVKAITLYAFPLKILMVCGR